jgi:hypothetical protein
VVAERFAVGSPGVRTRWRFAALALALFVALPAAPSGGLGTVVAVHAGVAGPATNSSAVGNFTASIGRLVELVGLAGGGVLALVWARVALSWFSNDITKKVQAKDRARDALIGTLLFTAAVTGLFWGLAHWVLTGT